MIDFIREEFGINPQIQGKVLFSIGVILVLWLLRVLLLRIVWRQTEDARARYLWKRGISITITLTAIILVSSIWITAFQKFGAFLGLVSAGLAIALRDPLTNIAGWLFITTRSPFQVGDRVQIDENTGDIIDIRLFQFTLLEVGNWVEADQSTGRIIHVPNSIVFQKPQANYSKGFRYIWNEIPVLVTFESDWKAAKEILQTIGHKTSNALSKPAKQRIREATKKYLITYTHLTPIVYTTVKESGILLTLRYLCNPKKRRSSEHSIWEYILEEFRKNPDIEFAYPTTRFFSRDQEKSD